MHNIKIKKLIVTVPFILMSCANIDNNDMHSDAKYLQKIYLLKSENRELKRNIIQLNAQIKALKKEIKTEKEKAKILLN